MFVCGVPVCRPVAAATRWWLAVRVRVPPPFFFSASAVCGRRPPLVCVSLWDPLVSARRVCLGVGARAWRVARTHLPSPFVVSRATAVTSCDALFSSFRCNLFARCERQTPRTIPRTPSRGPRTLRGGGGRFPPPPPRWVDRVDRGAIQCWVPPTRSRLPSLAAHLSSAEARRRDCAHHTAYPRPPPFGSTRPPRPSLLPHPRAPRPTRQPPHRSTSGRSCSPAAHPHPPCPSHSRTARQSGRGSGAPAAPRP